MRRRVPVHLHSNIAYHSALQHYRKSTVSTTTWHTYLLPFTGLVGVIPAMGIMTVEQNPPDGPVILSYGQLVLWSLALAFLGVFCAVPLRTQTILKEKLRFPSGTATANVIRTLHAVPEAPQPPEHLQSVTVIPEEPGKQCTQQLCCQGHASVKYVCVLTVNGH